MNTMLQSIFHVSQVTPTRYHPIRNDSGLKLILPNKDSLKKFLSPEAKKALAKKNFKVQETPAILAEKTLYVRYVPDCTWECQARDPQDVLYWINLKNNVQAKDVYLPPEPQFWMKVVLDKVSDAERLKKEGIRLKHTIVLPSDIRFETYIEVPQCTRCYSLEHSIAKCKKRQGYRVCSKCGQEGHLYMGCSEPARCLNCGGPHSAFSLTCANKKEARNEVRRNRARSSSSKRPKQSQGQPNSGKTAKASYAAAVNPGAKSGPASSGQPAGGARPKTSFTQGGIYTNPQPGPSHIPDPVIPPQINPQLQVSPQGAPQVDNKMIYTIYACAAYATFSSDPNAFNKMLVANGLPSVVIPQDLIGNTRNPSLTAPLAPATAPIPTIPAQQPSSIPTPSLPTSTSLPYTPSTPAFLGTPIPDPKPLPNPPSLTPLSSTPLSPLNLTPSVSPSIPNSAPDTLTEPVQGASSAPPTKPVVTISPGRESGYSADDSKDSSIDLTTPKRIPSRGPSEDCSPQSSNSEEPINVDSDGDEGFTKVDSRRLRNREIKATPKGKQPSKRDAS